MPAGMHVHLGEWSLAALTARERTFWKELAHEIPELCLMPDRYASDPERWGPYVTLPDNQLLPHGPDDTDRTGPPFVWRHDRRIATKVLTHYVRKITSSIARGDVLRSATFAAALGHYVQDCAGAGHVVNHFLMLRLLPDACARVAHIHRALDDVEAPRPPRFRPTLLGASVAEAAFNAEGALQSIIESALAAVVPMVQAIGARKTACLPALLAPAYHAAVRLAASLWHTCFTLAWNDASESDRKRLDAAPLSDRRPDDAFTLDPYPWEPRSGTALDESGDAVPLRLRVRAAGRVRTRTFQRGIAMVHGHAMYRIPPRVYHHLRVRVGLLVRAGQQEDAEATFSVVLAREAPTYEYATARVLAKGGKVAAVVKLAAGDPSREITVPLANARAVTLLAQATPLCTHVVWADPVLLKE